MKRRYASHYLCNLHNDYLKYYVVEVVDGIPGDYFPLHDEVEAVEWLPGVIELEQKDGKIYAYHLYPYDFIEMKPVAETQRRLLL